MNANASIYVTFLTPQHHVNLTDSTFVEILRQYKNVKFKYVNIKDFAKNTPLERWIQSDELNNSNFVVSHTSDVLRYLLLYKYSGLYLDLDVIVTSPFGQINFENFACSESREYLNGAVLKLTGNTGHKLAETFLM
jgi:lactosylceramide 4-alpha-galactosyltransferase